MSVVDSDSRLVMYSYGEESIVREAQLAGFVSKVKKMKKMFTLHNLYTYKEQR